MKKLDEISIEVVDILEEMKMFNDRISETVCTNMNDEQKKSYDLGVKNTMSVLKDLISSTEFESDNARQVEKDRIIYQKYGTPSSYIVRYIRLSDALKELYGGD